MRSLRHYIYRKAALHYGATILAQCNREIAGDYKAGVYIVDVYIFEDCGMIALYSKIHIKPQPLAGPKTITQLHRHYLLYFRNDKIYRYGVDGSVEDRNLNIY